MKGRLLAVSVLLACTAVLALEVTDITEFGRQAYGISWTDNDGAERTVSLYKTAASGYVGVIPHFTYYHDGDLMDVVPADPNAGALNAGFGSTCHHNSGSHHGGGTLTLRYQGPSIAIFDWTHTIDNVPETVTYTFMDGHDYFQWAQTDDVRNGSVGGDSRGPYCTIMWNVTGAIAEGVAYAAHRYYWQPVYNQAWTFTGVVDIPYAWEWGEGLEIGYVQTQTYDQQVAGCPALSDLRPESGPYMANSQIPYFDYQMNFYDQWLKVTWGLSYGWMSGTAPGIKDGWGQYSLSIVLDAHEEAGVMRVRDENRATHNGSVALTASTGTVKTQGPVGTQNPNLQTLDPPGYDHNYRAWWVDAASNAAVLDFTITGLTPLQNPTFRIGNINALPSSVALNSVNLASGTGYYASYDSGNNEVWLTFIAEMGGHNVIEINSPDNSGITISDYTASPSSVVNNVATDVTLTATVADAGGSVSGVTVDLTPVGGGAAVAMTNSGGSIYTTTFTVAADVEAGPRYLALTATDNSGNDRPASLLFDVLEYDSGLRISNFKADQYVVTNAGPVSITFTADVSDLDGTVESVALDLSNLGGGNSVAMTAGAGSLYSHTFAMQAASSALDTFDVSITAVDDESNGLTETTTVEVREAVANTVADVPGRIEAEDFNLGGEGLGYHDDGPMNRGGEYRTAEGVDVEVCSEGGYNVGYITKGEWIAYDINVPIDSFYAFTFRVGSGADGVKILHVEVDYVDKTGPVEISYTDGWQTWHDVSVSGVWIGNGRHNVRIYAETADFNFNYFDVSYSDGTAAKPAVVAADLKPALTGIARAPLGGSRDFVISTRGSGVLTIHDLQGKVLRRVHTGDRQSQHVWNVGSAGVYLVEFEAAGVKQKQKVIVR